MCGGLHLHSSFTSQMGERGPFEGYSLLGYDPRSKKYVGTWVDNSTPSPTHFTGEYNQDNSTFTIHSVVADPSGNQMKSKQVTTWLGESTEDLDVFLVVEAGGKEQNIKLMEMLAQKRK